MVILFKNGLKTTIFIAITSGPIYRPAKFVILTGLSSFMEMLKMTKINEVNSYCNGEIDNSLLLIIGNVGRLDSNVRDIDGAREEEENGEAGQQEAESHRYGDVKLPGGEKKQVVRT